jgi:hypothetical protein
MPTGAAGLRLGLHLGYCGADDAEDAVEVGAESVAPLLGGHGGDGLVVRGPDAVVEDGAVETAEGSDGSGDEGLTVFGSGERLLDGSAEIGAAAFCDEGFGLWSGGAITEDDPGSGLVKETDGGSTNAAGASGDEGNFAQERHGDT